MSYLRLGHPPPDLHHHHLSSYRQREPGLLIDWHLLPASSALIRQLVFNFESGLDEVACPSRAPCSTLITARSHPNTDWDRDQRHQDCDQGCCFSSVRIPASLGALPPRLSCHLEQPPSAKAIAVMHPCAPPQDPVPLASNLLSFAAIARRSTSQTGRLLAAVLEHTTLASFDSDTAEVTAEDIGSCPCSMRP